MTGHRLPATDSEEFASFMPSGIVPDGMELLSVERRVNSVFKDGVASAVFTLTGTYGVPEDLEEGE